MAVNTAQYKQILEELHAQQVDLVAVSKVQPAAAIEQLYALGQRDFGENYVQELVDKQAMLPKDIRWHFIGHLQSNKVKYIVPFVHLIHGVDSLKLLKEIQKQGKKIDRIINCLLQVHIAQEETKFGMDDAELTEAMHTVKNDPAAFSHVHIQGLMGMASFSDDAGKVTSELKHLKALYNTCAGTADWPGFAICSMGMSGDYKLAVAHGSTMVRIGSLLFGARL